MPKKENEEIVLKCDECGEFMHIKVVSKFKEHNGKNVKAFSPKIFCPQCDKESIIFNHFKQQHEKEKREKQIAL